MATNKDIREIMEARKAARRAIPQVDPAEVVAGPPEPEVAVPPQVTNPEPPVPDAADDQEQEVELTFIPSAKERPDKVVVMEPDDPRTQPVPPDDSAMPTTLRIKRHQHRQLKAEAYYKGLLMQDVMETALEEYFKKRYGRKGRG